MNVSKVGFELLIRSEYVVSKLTLQKENVFSWDFI